MIRARRLEFWGSYGWLDVIGLYTLEDGQNCYDYYGACLYDSHNGEVLVTSIRSIPDKCFACHLFPVFPNYHNPDLFRQT